MSEKAISDSPHSEEPASIGSDDAAAAREIPGANNQTNGHANGAATTATRRKTTAFAEDSIAPRDPTRTETFDSRGSRRSGRRQDSGGSVMSRISSMLKPERKLGKDPTLKASALAIVKASWLNVLLVFIPVGWALVRRRAI